MKLFYFKLAFALFALTCICNLNAGYYSDQIANDMNNFMLQNAKRSNFFLLKQSIESNRNVVENNVYAFTNPQTNIEDLFERIDDHRLTAGARPSGDNSDVYFAKTVDGTIYLITKVEYSSRKGDETFDNLTLHNRVIKLEYLAPSNQPMYFCYRIMANPGYTILEKPLAFTFVEVNEFLISILNGIISNRLPELLDDEGRSTLFLNEKGKLSLITNKFSTIEIELMNYIESLETTLLAMTSSHATHYQAVLSASRAWKEQYAGMMTADQLPMFLQQITIFYIEAILEVSYQEMARVFSVIVRHI